MILPYLGVLLMFLFAFGEGLWEVAEIKRDIREQELALGEVQARKEELEEERALASDPDALHIKMRRLGYIYPGETVYLDGD